MYLMLPCPNGPTPMQIQTLCNHPANATAAQKEDLDQITALEIAGFSSEEAEAPEKIAHRLQTAGGFFMVAVRQEATLASASSDSETTAGLTYTDAVVGFICGTCMTAERLSNVCFNSHEPEGPRLCIHSVVVRKDLQRQGVAQRMLKAYFMFMRGTAEYVTHIHLASKPLLVRVVGSNRIFIYVGGMHLQCVKHD